MIKQLFKTFFASTCSVMLFSFGVGFLIICAMLASKGSSAHGPALMSAIIVGGGVVYLSYFVGKNHIDAEKWRSRKDGSE